MVSLYKLVLPSQLRTRSSLLEALRCELSSRSQCMLGEPSQPSIPLTEGGRSAPEGGGGFIENFKVDLVHWEQQTIGLDVVTQMSWHKMYIKSITACLSLSLRDQRAIRVRSHSFDTLGVPKKAAGVAGQRTKVSKYLMFYQLSKEYYHFMVVLKWSCFVSTSLY